MLALMDPVPGSTLGGYRIDALLGRGGMGVVYRATQIALDRPAAIKLIAAEYADDAVFRERFKREARLAARLDHPHVLPVYEAGEVDGRLFLATRFVDGTDLEAVIAGEGALEPGLAAGLIAQIGDALDAAHALNLVHRDVKPANVLLESRGGMAHAYLGDFGLTKAIGSASGLTSTSVWVGTVDYAAPEQLQSQLVDARTDVYSLGCLLYEALTGEVPYPRPREVSKVMAHASDPPPVVSAVAPAVPAEFDAIVRRAMAKRPEDRYQSAGELGRAAAAAAGISDPAHAVPLAGRFLERPQPSAERIDLGAATAG
jgi:serine/threonine protein kinase